ncbi:MAG: hypothetical protein COT26_01345 [Candidatus Kerfeldbacteria bacterium CG08_land_8_20_14_0_20_43_14]|uniref:Integrase catalytic domain-containing protein n=1 Tax=Candidatus Kerfeldbacteria bacterium CG08_land_8_20_14_0_20_43_14 TaxID=2014246 RepID=A0A2H0YSS9_9BACT|nr:MAG: hypothetical protein COT26_01345 [Candidatus Kerfeldbacteria bacterium CG08_land_8_20_14_0_20_43_14]
MLRYLHKLKNKTAKENENSIVKVVESLPFYWFKTLTRDNGLENARHHKTFADFNIPSYFCDPYSSWQKGGVENLNKLIRQYFPKKTDFTKVKKRDILKVQEILNNRPRKSLNYLTPNEIFASHS